ncbi:rhythmically expressed gene 5 protein [Homalodisca vitripennis]|uniref:rhythmically expressed gene 5 protein n=1 Tax=Homalodisca vitripennis TaxID=197043 RepID=UPI001EEB2B9A|nr:rhythmically expressed gene 5 protein [Homalodisca vitripennis]
MDTVVCRVCLALTLLGAVTSSAIPMWEFLSREEKMSHLFNMFAKQVTEHCDSSTMPDCNKVLMVYGLSNLAKMGDESLDKMDPYQRGAMDIIWDSMMKGSYKTTGQTAHSDTFQNEPVTSDNHLEAASSNVEQFAGSPHYVMGPMVVRVYPDGRPVPGDAAKPLPRDEDAEEFIAMRSKPVPTMVELLSHKQPTATIR